jgi:DUF4097 and DUF4098 domain-containing protein YvlB
MKTALRPFIFALAMLAALPVIAAERTLELRIDGVQPVQIHNLVGTARLVPGDGELVIRASVSAEQPALADAVRLRRSEDRNGVVVVVVEYPEDLKRVRYDGAEFRRLDTSVEYQGRRVRITNTGGEAVRVDLEIQVPAERMVEFTQGVGGIQAGRIHADLALTARHGVVGVTDGAGRVVATTGSGAVNVASFRGDVETTTGSGEVGIENVLGQVNARTGSGRITIRGVNGDVVARTGSGGIRLSDLEGSLNARTGSGGVRVEALASGADLEIGTGSGAVSVAGDLGAVRNVQVRTGSGSVTLESSTPLSLRLDLSTGSGSFRVDVPTLSHVDSGRRNFRAQVGAGEGTAKVSTGSGSIRISAP